MSPRRCGACSCIAQTTSRGSTRRSTSSFARTARRRLDCRCSRSASARGSSRRPAPGAALRVELDGAEPGAARRHARRRRLERGRRAAHEGLRRLHRRRARARAVLLRDLPWSLGVRRTRRWQRARRGDVDLRPLLRRNLTRGGELLDLPRRTRATGLRPIVVLADVSGSMERYSRVLLYFVYGLAHSAARVEAFLFATRLTRVTRPLIEHARRRGVHARRARRPGLGRRHAHRRGAAHLQPALGPAGHAQRSGRADRVGRLGPRRSGAARPRAGAPPPQLPPPDLAQSAARVGELRAADARHAGGAPARRRLPAGPQSRQPRGAREPPAAAAGAVEAGGMEAGCDQDPSLQAEGQR